MSTYTESTMSNASDNADDVSAPKAVDLRTAAAMTNTSIAAIRGRVERGSLRHVKRDGKRLVPVSELRRAGLLDAPSDVSDAPTMRAMLERLLEAERRATAAQVRLQLTEQAESTLTEELHRANLERAAAVERAEQLAVEAEQLAAQSEKATAHAEKLAVEVEQLQAAMQQRRGWFRSRRSRAYIHA